MSTKAMSVNISMKTLGKDGFVGVVKSKWQSFVTTLHGSMWAAYRAAVLLAKQISNMNLHMFERFRNQPVFVTRTLGLENSPIVKKF